MSLLAARVGGRARLLRLLMVWQQRGGRRPLWCKRRRIRVCWVSPREKPPRWIAAVPAVQVRAPEERGEPWVVDDGLAGFDYRAGSWEFREEELRCFVRWALHSQLVPAESYPRYRRRHRLVAGDWYTFRRGLERGPSSR